MLLLGGNYRKRIAKPLQVRSIVFTSYADYRRTLAGDPTKKRSVSTTVIYRRSPTFTTFRLGRSFCPGSEEILLHDSGQI